MPRFLIERTIPSGTSYLDLDSGAKQVIASSRSAPSVRWVRRLLSSDRTKLFDEFEGINAEECLRLAQVAGLPCDAIREVVELTPDMYMDDPSPDGEAATSQTWI